MKRFLLLLVLLNCSGICLAASFDCAKAKTDIENQICGNPELSEVDSKLGATYFIHRDKEGLSTEQKHWLKQVRDTCSDQACLKKVYTDRIDAIDPLADGMISCENMRQYPERIFTDAIDLGSGSISPIEVDYACPESLASLPFLKKLLDLTELIRHEEQDQLCVGTIVRALRRYYYFNLAESGFAPQLLIKQLPSDSLARQAKVLGYFQQWAEKSSYNLTMHRQYFSEFEKVLPLLVAHYKNHFKLSETQASAAARYALMGLVYRAAGAFPEQAYIPESKLVMLVREPQTKLEDLNTLLANSSEDSQSAPKPQIYQALKSALLYGRPKAFIAALMEKLTASDLSNFQYDSEPLLSLTIGNHENLRYLLEQQVAVNAANDFGKTALFYAIGDNDHQAVELLLTHKANVNQVYKSASELRNGDKCVYPNLVHTQRTPLMHAAQHADVEMLKLLLKHGANLNAVDESGFNALDFAVVMASNKANQAYLKSLGLESNKRVSG